MRASPRKEKMRWAVIGKDDLENLSGGLNRYVFGLASAMKGLGYCVDLYVAGHSASPVVDYAGPGNTFQRILWFLRFGWIAGRDVTVVNIHFALYGAPFLVGVKLRRAVSRLFKRSVPDLKVIVTYHGPWAEESRVAERKNGLLVKIKGAFEQHCVSQAHSVITLSSTFANDVIQRFSVPVSKVSQLNPGIDSAWFSKATVHHRKQNTIQLICVRRLTARMGHLELLGTLESIGFNVGGTAVRLAVVGIGTEAPCLEKWVADHNRGESVMLLGRLSDGDLRKVMEASTAAIVPTLELEGFGLVVLEAMAMGLPVISTGQGGLAEAMGPWGKPPHIFDITDPTSVMDAIQEATRLASSASEVTALQAYARNFDWPSVARRMSLMVDGRL